jgi:DNA primase
LRQQPKYINTGDTLVYKKTNELFALNLAKVLQRNLHSMRRIYFVIACIGGLYKRRCSFGTALTSEQVRLISRYAKEIILAYDNERQVKSP